MKNNWYINNFAFRISTTLIAGVLVYLLILLFFDSVSEIRENFFSSEVLFVIIVALFVFELNRLLIILLDRKLSVYGKLGVRIVVQLAGSVLITISLVSMLLYMYFVNFVGFTTISTELMAFNIVFAIVAILYHLYFFSIVYMKKHNEAIIKSEVSKRENIELEMKAFSNYVNPDFLFSSLEIVITELHRRNNKVDDLIAGLAEIYRYTLDNQQVELVSLSDDYKNFERIVEIFKIKFGKAISTSFLNNGQTDYHLIPGTLQVLFEYAVFNNIITNEIPLVFDITVVTDNLIVSYKCNDRLVEPDMKNSRLESLERAYKIYNNNGIRVDKSEDFINIMVPLIKVTEE